MAVKENRIGAERARIRISQYKLAKMLGVSNRTLWAWEQDHTKISATSLAQMANIFGCSSDYLLGLCSERNPSHNPRANRLEKA